MVKDIEGFDEEVEKLEENSEEELKEDSSNEGGGIFDEDLELDDSEEVSDFSIGDTILSSASSSQGRQGHNLEELADRKKIEDSKWNDSSEFDREENSGKNFYGSLSKDFYGESQNRDSLYQNNNKDLRNNGSGNSYSEKNNGKNTYVAEKIHTKSYDEFVDSRRSGRSMLEITGFEDEEKQRFRDMRGFVRHEGKED